MEKDFPEILRDYVSEQRQKNPTTNETPIFKKMDIPPTIFNRLVNGHSQPAVKTLLKLSRFIPELQQFLPEGVVKVFKVAIEKESSEYVGQTLETLLSDKNVFLCWMLAFANKGVIADEMKSYFGHQGIKALQTLERNDIISKDENNRYKVIEKNKYVTFSFRLIKAHLMFLAEQFKSDNLNNNYIHYWVESLNKKGRKELMRAHQEFHRKVGKIMDDKDNQGDKPAFSIACSDLFSEEEPREGEI